jgi:enoyl-CoA hydratase/carnithine racemase
MHHSDPTHGLPMFALADGVATITLNRPAHLNRLHREDLQAMQRLFSQLSNNASVRALVLTGSGRAFCAGFNLGDFEGGAIDGPRMFEQTVDALEALAVPTVCRLNGSIYGGATDLALACDFRVGVESMELRMPAARLGLHYYPNGMARYVSRLGLSSAKRLFLLAEAVAADELLRIGYLDRVAAPDALDAEVQAIVSALVAGAPLAVQGMKQSLNDIARGGFDLTVLQRREALCAASADLQEGLAAFAQRRPPKFHAR